MKPKRLYTKRGIRSSRTRRHQSPRTADQYFAMSPRLQSIWDRVIAVVAKMRGEGISLQQASRAVGISPKTVTRWAGRALRKSENGRYTVTARDRLLRVMTVPTANGKTEIVLPDSRQATLLAKYWNAVHRYLNTGDAAGLEEFHGKKITDANGNGFLLITDPAELKRLGFAGELSFESVYARSM